MKITKEYDGIRYFDAWSGAIDTKNRTIEEDKEDEFDFLLESIYGDEIDETTLNDFLWFEDEYIFEELGISNDDDDDDDDEED